MTKAFQIQAEKVSVNLENGTVIVTGIDADELVGEFNVHDILDAVASEFGFAEIVDYVTYNQENDE